MNKKRKTRPKRKRQRSPKAPSSTERIDINISELEAIIERAKGALSEQEYQTLQAVVKTNAFFT